MKHFFDYDAPLMKALRQISYMILLNFVFLLSCLPVITIGASVAALYGVLCSDFDQNPAGAYFRLWKQNFVHATKCFLLLLLVGIVIFIDYCLSRSGTTQAPTVFSFTLLAAGFLLVMTAGYLFPLCALKGKCAVGVLYRQSIQYMLRYLPRSLLIGLINLLPPVLILYYPYYFLRFGFVFFLVGFSFLAKIISLLLHTPFSGLLPTKELPKQKECTTSAESFSSNAFYREFETKNREK